jgi:hypothetical protein
MRQHGAGHGTKKKSKSKSKSRSISVSTYKKAAINRPFKTLSAKKLKSVYKTFKSTRKGILTNRELLNAAVATSRATGNNLLILYRKLLITKIFIKQQIAFYNDPHIKRAHRDALASINALKNKVIESLDSIYKKYLIVDPDTYTSYNAEFKQILDENMYGTFREVLEALKPGNNNAMNGGIKAEMQEEIEEDELGDELLGAFAALKVRGNANENDKEVDDAVAELFAGLKL